MKAIAVIPARLASTRLPRKMLREIAGVPLIGHVYKAVRSSPLLEDVIVATDSDEIFQVCRKNDWNARMTSPDHRSGTERVHEISNSVHAEVYINVHANKVVMDLAGRALYFSHATIPFDRDGANPRYLKHLGIYGYRKSALDRFVALPESSLERIERLEQLRFLENGVDIHVAVTPYDSIGVDTEDDLRQFEQSLRTR